MANRKGSLERLNNALMQQYVNLKRRYPHLLVSDREYIENRYGDVFGRLPDLENPKTFNEKIQWMKLYYRQPLISRLADKYLVKDYVREKVGGQYLPDEFGVYETVEDFLEDLPNLPTQFVLRANHGWGWNTFVEDKNEITEEELDLLRTRLSQNYYWYAREWAYKDIEPKLLCERFIDPVDPGRGLVDYKYFCFHGEPKFLHVDFDRFTDHSRILFDLSWNKIPVAYNYKLSQKTMPKPKTHELMMELARLLSVDLPFVRVDFYSEERVIVGEMSFYPVDGLGQFTPEEYDYRFGELLDLSRIPQSHVNSRKIFAGIRNLLPL